MEAEAGRAVVGRGPARSWVVPAAGVAFAVLLVGGMIQGGAPDTAHKSAAEVIKTFNDEKSGAVIAMYMLILAALTFLPLAIATLDHVRVGLSAFAELVARGVVLVFAASLVAAGAAFGTLAATVVIGNERAPAAELVRFVPQLGYPLVLLGGGLSAAVFLAIVSRAGQRSGAVPTWFVILGYLAALAMLVAVLYIPMLLLPIWALAAAFVLRPGASLAS